MTPVAGVDRWDVLEELGLDELFERTGAANSLSQLGLETYVLILLATVVLGTAGLVAALGQGLALLSGNIVATAERS
ncbi:MAG TPA: hypothetical protein VFR69_08065 [Rubrobacteraceae bacterium]|nr:hypothetical protein [Rubrobacteraceae bacterium]